MPSKLSASGVAMLTAAIITMSSARARAQEPAPNPPPAEPAPTLRQTAPESGAGLMAGGTYMLVGGTGLVVTGSYLTAVHPENWAGMIVGGVALAGAGSTLVWLGSRRARKLRAWSDETGLTPPPNGTALLVSGVTVGAGGLISMIAYGVLSIGYCEDNCFSADPRLWFGLAGSAVASGLGMVIAGAVVRRRHHRWRSGEAVGRAWVMPSFAFSPGGAQLGVVGRF